MKRFYSMTIALVGTLLCVVLLQAATLRGFDTSDAERVKAERLWEQAIAAKGGRERLHAVRNFVISSYARNRWGAARDVIPQQHQERFVVLPDRWWLWADYRPGAMGLSIEVLDLERRAGWAVSDKRPMAVRLFEHRPDTDIPAFVTREQIERGWRDSLNYSRQVMGELLYIYFMETQWVRTKPIRSHSDVIGFFQKVDVVEAIVNNQRVKFYLDSRTHLPMRIEITTALQETETDFTKTVTLSDYTDVNGIQMPRKVDVFRTNYQINVEYDEGIFGRPPTIEAGPEAWRRAVK